jgi:threonine aldolase
VFVEIPAAHVAPIAAHLQAAVILASVGVHTRFVTHLDVNREQIEEVLRTLGDYRDAHPSNRDTSH